MASVLVRIPDEMHAALRDAVAQEGTNPNQLFRSLAEGYLKRREYQRLYDGFTALGDDPDSDVEYAIHAAAEVVLNDDEVRR